MTDKEVRKLSRSALLDLLIEETERNAQLEAKIEKLEKQLKSKTIAVSSAGSMADAALELNRVFSSADKAASQYLENIRAANQRCDEMIAQAKRQAVEIIAEAEAQAKELRGGFPRTSVPSAQPKQPRAPLWSSAEYSAEPQPELTRSKTGMNESRTGVKTQHNSEKQVRTNKQAPRREMEETRSPGYESRSKRPAQKNTSSKDDSRRSSKKRSDPVVDPFADAQLDDMLNKAFSEMRRRNSR